MEDTKSSILQMARGAIQERVDYEVAKVIDNILDVNTDAKTKRKITLNHPDGGSQVRHLPDAEGGDQTQSAAEALPYLH